MDQRTFRSRPATPAPAEKILEGRYAQLLKWGEVLARGDQGVARDIVHDLCLQLTLSKADFSEIASVDGYLYTCLRHIYLSRLARSSREAERFVSIADCDSVLFALDAGESVDSLEVQNQLRRICGYAVWRKEFSKSFSFFILHFFHGYFHREIASLACLPVSGIYNKLKSSRTELRAYLGEPGKLRFTNRESPPDTELSWAAVPSGELFRELRQRILDARIGACLPAEELLAWYGAEHATPLPCPLLAHIVSCERCLATVDRHLRQPTLKDRDALDGLDRSLSTRVGEEHGAGASNVHTTLDGVLRRKRRIYEHRPATLSIAVNGRIVAFHDVQGEHSLLSARIERPEDTQFVEAFSERSVRLALLSIESLPPEGPKLLSQRIRMSDDRWLELRLAFDGLGLSTEVAYFDPVLAADSSGEGLVEFWSVTGAGHDESPARAADRMHTGAMRARSAIARSFRSLPLSPARGWAFAVLCLICTALYLSHRLASRRSDASALLDESIRSEAASLQGRAEHQTMALEELAADGHLLVQGTVDLWLDGSGRYTRRLYDSRHRLVAAEWEQKDGTRGSSIANGASASEQDRQLVASPFWMVDVSSRAFGTMSGRAMRDSKTKTGYELTADVHIDDAPQVVSATLVLDSRLLPVGETLRLRIGSAIRQVRYLRLGFESEPASSVPDSVFNPGDPKEDHGSDQDSRSSVVPRGRLFQGADAALVQLQIGVLHKLYELHADTADPIQVERTADRRIRVEGTVADDLHKQEIVATLQSLPNRQSLDVEVVAQADIRVPAEVVKQAKSHPVTVYNVAQTDAPATALLRRYFEGRGLSGKQADAAVAQFARAALSHAQRALQDAHALDRLGSSFSARELRSISSASREQWAEMAAGHASALETELRALRDQLNELVPAGETAQTLPTDSDISTAAAFARTSKVLLQATQTLNRKIGLAFVSDAFGTEEQNPEQLIRLAAKSIPLPESARISEFAAQFAGAEEKSGGRNTRADRQFSVPPR
jgi:DNA-directed RNA polymerase specialized sigma24 family protein